MNPQTNYQSFFDFQPPRNPNYVPDIEVVGRCLVMGAVHLDKSMIAVAITGAHTSVDAVRAKLSMGKTITINNFPEGYYSYNTAFKGMDSFYDAFNVRDEQLRDDHHLIISRAAYGVVKNSLWTFIQAQTGPRYIYSYNSEYVQAKFGERMREMLNIPYFDAWTGNLLREGERRKQVRQADGFGMNFFAIANNPEYWTGLISSGLKDGSLKFPSKTVTATN